MVTLPKTSRLKSTVDVATRIVAVKGWAYCLAIYEAALPSATSFTKQDNDSYFDNIVWPTLKKYRVASAPSKAIADDQIDDLKLSTKKRWLGYADRGRCRLHAGVINGSRYPEVSVRLGPGKETTKKLALHQMPERIREMAENNQISNWKEGDMVASHLCNQKTCLVCAVKEPRSKNMSRGYCTCYQMVNSKLVWVCTHTPKCRDFGSNAFWKQK